ncbi:hypothetical protein NDU88_005360 [Pleurodeles waltl]|uniref:Uncharacterized protein n=1 Tax=Pleurodeles waltl TaxID=8319 RepID=A0AAV7TCA9_PLEWA|nr:hypothetical protein NDU88_005360 [Pleurodeles waltl]
MGAFTATPCHRGTRPADQRYIVPQGAPLRRTPGPTLRVFKSQDSPCQKVPSLQRPPACRGRRPADHRSIIPQGAPLRRTPPDEERARHRLEEAGLGPPLSFNIHQGHSLGKPSDS